MTRGGNATHGNCKEVQRFIPKKNKFYNSMASYHSTRHPHTLTKKP